MDPADIADIYMMNDLSSMGRFAQASGNAASAFWNAIRSIAVAAFSHTLPVFWQMARKVMWFLSGRLFIMSMMATAALNRTMVFASTRRAVRPPLWAVLLLRGGLIGVYLWILPQFWNGPDAKDLASLMSYITLSFYVELLLSGLEKKEPHFDSGFTLFEFSLIFQDFTGYANKEPPKNRALYAAGERVMRNFCLLTIGAQILLHLRGLIPQARKYRLVFSTVVSLAFLGNFLYEVYQEIGIVQHVMLAFCSLLRHGPQLILGTIVLTCWGIYYSAALVLGSRRNLNMYVEQEDLLVQWSDGFFLSLLKRAIHCLVTMPDANYLQEAPLIKKPLYTFLEALVLEHAKKGGKLEYGECGYSHEIEVPDDDNHQHTTKDAQSRWWVDTMWVPLFTRLQASFTLLVWFVRALGGYVRRSARSVQGTPEPQTPRDNTHGFTDFRYMWLDSGRPGAHLALLLDAPEVDPSPDWDPSMVQSDSELESEIESDDEVEETEQELERDLVYAARATMEILSQPGGAELVSAHMAGRVTRTMIEHDRDPARDLAQILVHKRSPDRGELNPDLCVVCFTNPRRVILWPCRCLALCDDCRVALSVKRYSTCICCRRPVQSYSRIFVP